MSADYQPRSGGGRRGHYYSRRRSRNGDRERFQRPQQTETGFFAKIKGFVSKLFKGKPDGAPDRSGGGFSRSDAQYRSPRPPRDPQTERTERPERPPEEITTPRLYVGNLSYDAVESDLFDLFSQAGSVKNVEIVMDRRTNRCKGFGFVEMESLESAKAAAAKFSRTEFLGRQILVMGAKSERRESGMGSEPSAP